MQPQQPFLTRRCRSRPGCYSKQFEHLSWVSGAGVHSSLACMTVHNMIPQCTTCAEHTARQSEHGAQVSWSAEDSYLGSPRCLRDTTGMSAMRA